MKKSFIERLKSKAFLLRLKFEIHFLGFCFNSLLLKIKIDSLFRQAITNILNGILFIFLEGIYSPLRMQIGLFQIRQALSCRDGEKLKKLSRSRFSAVRLAVAANKNTPGDITAKMAFDADKDVREVIWTHRRQTPESAVNYFIEGKISRETLAFALNNRRFRHSAFEDSFERINAANPKDEFHNILQFLYCKRTPRFLVRKLWIRVRDCAYFDGDMKLRALKLVMNHKSFRGVLLGE
jgi:hypothetical protein